MLKPTQGRIYARKYSERVELYSASTTLDGYGEATQNEPVLLSCVSAQVVRLNATRQLYYYERANVVGLEITIRYRSEMPNLVKWQGHDIIVKSCENIDNRNRELRIIGSYKEEDGSDL